MAAGPSSLLGSALSAVHGCRLRSRLGALSLHERALLAPAAGAAQRSDGPAARHRKMERAAHALKLFGWGGPSPSRRLPAPRDLGSFPLAAATG